MSAHDGGMCAHDGGMCTQLLAFVAEHTEAGEAKLAGNSVHVDAQFLRARMPRLHAHFHHRIVDVSTVAELAARWFPQQFRRAPRKQARPRGLANPWLFMSPIL